VKKKAAKGTTRKHAGTGKHHGTSKHHPTHHKHHAKTASGGHQTAVAKHPHHAKARTMPLAQAESRVRPGITPFASRERLDGPGAWVLADVACCSAEAVAASLRLAGWPVGDEDILALHAAAGGSQDAGVTILAALEAACEFGLAGLRPIGFEEVMPCDYPLLPQRATGAGLILGAELPGPHAVCADAETWWTWGEAWCPCAFPDAVVEEAWSVRWPSWL
jgi:hypothetical protein